MLAMPIAQLKPTAQPPVILNEPKIESKDYCSTTIDNQINPLASLLSYVSGMPWTVNYYRQVITTQSDLKEQDIGQANIYQQYEKIEKMEIRVTESITGAQNTQFAQMRVSGSALVYPFMVPNVGDTFLSDAGYGQPGIYTIDTVERKSFNKESVYQIQYHLLDFLTGNEARFADLESKVIRTYVFDKSRLTQGLSPTLSTQDYANVQSLAQLYKIIVQYYFKTFYNKNYDTLVIPGQGTGAYDPYLVDYLLRIVDTFDAQEIRFVRNYAVDGDPFSAQDQFWKVLLNRDPNMLPYVNWYMGLVMTKFFNYNSMFKGIRYSRLSYVLYPVNPDFSLINPNAVENIGDPLLMDYGVFQDGVFTDSPIFKPQALQQIEEAKTQGASLADLIKNQYVAQSQSPALIPSVINKTNTYVLTEAFYRNTPGQTLLESLVQNYIASNALNLSDLLKCAQPFRQWGRLEQFYYLPILLTLIKAAQQETCSS
jgi:hypothetical protein